MYMDDSVSSVNTKHKPSSWRCFLRFLKVLKDTAVGCGFSRTFSKSSLSCCGREEFALANNCLAFSLNFSPTSKAVAIITLSQMTGFRRCTVKNIYPFSTSGQYLGHITIWCVENLVKIYSRRFICIVLSCHTEGEELRGQPYWLPCDTVTYWSCDQWCKLRVLEM